MIKTSEYVSPGHPDKMCDYVSSYILDRLLEIDEQTRFALEVQAKDETVNLAGEITTRAFPSKLPAKLGQWTCDAVAEIGYTEDYARRWEGCAPSADRLVVNQFVSRQSPDIAEGVDRNGWGDQGIFFGMAASEKEFDFMPRDIFIARRLGFDLYLLAREGALPIGLDIKTQVSIDTTDGEVVEIIVAAPIIAVDDRLVIRKINYFVKKTVQDLTGQQHVPDAIINGTGSYRVHSTLADAGTTGRKLAVDFYGGNCPIGGGSPWTKDGTKADLALNIYARHLAVRARFAHAANPSSPIFSAISCCIGSQEIICGLYEGFDGSPMAEWRERIPAHKIIAQLGLRRPVFAHKCLSGLFKLPPNIVPLNILGEVA